MRVLVVGSSGLLGSNVVAAARDAGATAVGTYHSNAPVDDESAVRLDVRDESAVARAVERASPDAVVNCAATTDVDACEEAPERAREVNVAGARHVASEAATVDAALVYVSTDYVFDGTASEPYAETAEPAPVQAYGETKLAGSRAVEDAHPNPIVVRPSFVWGVHRARDALAGFPGWLCERLRDGRLTSLYDDQHVTPSRAGQVAGVVLDLLSADTAGVFHVASQTCTTPYQFGQTIRRAMDAPPTLVERGELRSADRAAERPRYTCLDPSRVERTLDSQQPTLLEDVATVEDRLM